MYRKRNRSRGFSWTSFVNAAVPNLFADAAPSTMSALEPFRKDMLYGHQLASADFVGLDESSVFVAGIVDSKRMSRTVFRALKKARIVTAADDSKGGDKGSNRGGGGGGGGDNGGGTGGRVDTYKIGANFINQVPMITTRRQKDLINMLFWWEEECHRYIKLRDEDDELTRLIDDARRQHLHSPVDDHDDHDDDNDRVAKERMDRLKFARERVRMKIRQRPSQRRPEFESDTDDILMEFYRGRALSAPETTLDSNTSADDLGVMSMDGSVRTATATAVQRTSRNNIDEKPPDYYRVTTSSR